MDRFDFGGDILWRPDDATIASANLTTFMRKYGIGSYDALLRRSTEDIAWFWDATIREMGFVFDRPYDKIVDLSAGVEWPKWCVGGRMNIVKSLLHRWMGTATADKTAIISEHDDGSVEKLTYRQLKARVEIAAGALLNRGIKAGDVVGVFMPMNADCVIAMLAVIYVGAVFLPLFSGYGAGAIIARMSDASAKALVSCSGVNRRGKFVAMWPVAEEVHATLAAAWQAIELINFESLATAPTGASVEPHIVDADEVMMLIYTSGTTGRPKGAVHTHCGFPIKSAADAWMGLDLKPDEIIWWMTDIGWMMGPWLVFSALAVGCTMLTYDGGPDHPHVSRIWDIGARHGVTTIGVSPTLIRSLMSHGDEPLKPHDLSAVRKFASTGEPWNPEPWKWLFETVGKGKCPIINYSGGTEISGGILMGNMVQPMAACAFAGALPGMDADVVDDTGKSVRGAVGELVIKQPWIGQTRGFLNDPKRYIETYWSRWPGVWVHGDFAAIDDKGQWYILGRSDDTIKVAGKRLGPAEIESILVAHADVKEAAVIGVPDEIKGQAIVCFVVANSPSSVSSDLEIALRASIVREQGKPLSPKRILFVPDLPRTRNGKIMRRVIRSAYLNEPVGDLSALENPDSIEAIGQAQST